MAMLSPFARARVKSGAATDAIDAALAPPAQAAPAGIAAGDGMENMPTTKPVADPNASGPAGAALGAPSPFQSHYGTVSGYLQDAVRNYAPTVQAAKSEQEAKGLSENYLRTLIPEIEKRGGKVGQIKGDKMQIDGKWVDLYEDIGGKSAPQYLVDEGGGGMGAGLGSSLAALLGGSSMGSALGQNQAAPELTSAGPDTASARLKAILDQLAAANATPLQQQQIVKGAGQRDATDRMLAEGRA